MLGGFTFTKLILGAFIAYVLNSCYVFYTLFNPEECHGDLSKCIKPAYSMGDFSAMKISIYTSRYISAKPKDMVLLWDSGEDSVNKYYDVSVNLTLPYATRRNGSLYAYVFVHPMKENVLDGNTKSSYQMHTLTKYMVPTDKAFNLIQGNKENSSQLPITHLHSKLSVYVGIQVKNFPRYAIPSEVYHLLHFNNKGEYLPMVYVDGLSTLKRQLMPVEKNTEKLPIRIYVSPVSLGRLRIWSSVEQTLGKMKELGFTDNDLDDMKGLFTDTNMYFLGMTFFIAAVHMLFDILAFKNDVSFWKNKKSMEGMSSRTVIWRCVSTTIIFFYLLDEKTSLLVLVPSGVGALIEFWKVKKALKVTVEWSTIIPKLKFGNRSKSEEETEQFDEQAMKYLSYALYPLLAAASVYSLVYQPHKSWYSWVIRSLVNGVYAFGFLFMLPQLFVNYKLKSVAHLPWRAFMYKAFNTFIDDVFAFIITMPTAHRVACFRDDIVFLVYLYQRWLYPVDKKRTNEYGMVFEENNDEIENETESKKDQ